MFQLPTEEEGRRYIYRLDRYRQDIQQIELRKETEKSWMVVPSSAKRLLRPVSYRPWIPKRMDKRKEACDVFDTIDEAWAALLHRADKAVESAEKHLEKAKLERNDAYQDRLAWDALMQRQEEANCQN